MYADAAAQARMSARSVREDFPARDRPSASRVNTIISRSSSSASMIAGGLVVPDGEHVLPLGVETDVQRPGADHHQQPRRRADQHRAGVRAGAGEPPHWW